MGTIRTELVYANPRFELCGVFDSNLEAAETVANTFSTEAFGDFESVLRRFGSKNNNNSLGSNMTLDGLVISVPTSSHGDYIKIAAENGLGSFVEKPVAECPDEIEELYDFCEERNVPLCCGFQRRFDESYARAAKLVRSGAIGKVSNANIVFGDSPGPSLDFLLEGGDIFYDLSVHDVDFIRWALNEEIESVYARGTSSRKELAECGIQDSATMMMTTDKGSIVTMSMNRRAAYGYDQRCEIFADNGKIHIGNEFETTTVVSDMDGDHLSRLKNSFDTRFRDAFSNEINSFADVLTGKAIWAIKKEDVVRVQRVAAAAKQSLETNQIVLV